MARSLRLWWKISGPI